MGIHIIMLILITFCFIFICHKKHFTTFSMLLPKFTFDITAICVLLVSVEHLVNKWLVKHFVSRSAVISHYTDIFLSFKSLNDQLENVMTQLLTYIKCNPCFRIHGINLIEDAPYYHKNINNSLCEVGLETTKSEEIVDIIEGHGGKGYAVSTQDEFGIHFVF